MQLQNSYIFLPNPYKKNDIQQKKQDNVIRVPTDDSFVSCLRSAFPNAIRDADHSLLFKSVYFFNFENKEISCEVKFLINSVVKTYYLDVIVSGKSRTQIVKGLEHIQATIENSSIPQNYIEIISYDAISEYYCNKIYPKLNELERNLRKLLFNIYVVNFGLDYYRMTVNGELQSKIKGIININRKSDREKLRNIYKVSNREVDEIARWQRFFYSFEFGDIQKLLFSKGWTNDDEQAKSRFLEENKDLSQLTDEELRTAFCKYTPQSDWERFFRSKISGLDAEKIIEEIRKSRNNIAHCKFFYRAEYESCSSAIHSLNKALISAIKITENQDFSDKNSEYIKNTLSGALETIGRFTQSISDMVKPALQSMGKIAETVSHYFEVYQKLDFSGYYKIFEGLLTPLALSDNSDSGEDRAKPTDETPNSDDEQ